MVGGRNFNKTHLVDFNRELHARAELIQVDAS